MGATFEGVGLRQDGAFGGEDQVAVEQVRSIEQSGDLGGGEAFGNGDAVLDAAGGAQDGQGLAQAGMGREGEFALAEKRVVACEPGGKAEFEGTGDEFGLGKRDRELGGGAGGDDDGAVGWQGAGGIKPAPDEGGGDADAHA